MRPTYIPTAALLITAILALGCTKRGELARRDTAAGRRVKDTLARLTCDDESTREAAAEALAKMGKEAVDGLGYIVDTMQHDEPQIRLAAIVVLKRLGDEASDAVPYLRGRAMIDDFPYVRNAALIAIEAIDPQTPRTWKRILGDHRVFSESDLQNLTIACQMEIPGEEVEVSELSPDAYSSRCIEIKEDFEAHVTKQELLSLYGEPDERYESHYSDISGFRYGPIVLRVSEREGNVHSNWICMPRLVAMMYSKFSMAPDATDEYPEWVPDLVLPESARQE
jgi:hypothetical protein